MSEKFNPALESRARFPVFHTMDLRWNDLDAYRHVNNVRFYTFFDTTIMNYLTVDGGFDLLDGPVVPFTVENLCRFHKSFVFGNRVHCGVRTARVGGSSVRYEFGLFADEETDVTATGYFIDVFVDRHSEQPCPIPDDIRRHLEAILVT